MKLIIIKQFDDINNLLTINVKLYVDKFHNHTLKFLNNIKINFVVKFATENEMIKEYVFAIINKNMQEMKWQINLNALKKIDNIHLNFKAVYNTKKISKKHILIFALKMSNKNETHRWINDLKFCKHWMKIFYLLN